MPEHVYLHLHLPDRDEWLCEPGAGLVSELEVLREEVGRLCDKPGEVEVNLELGQGWREVVEGLGQPGREVAEVVGVLGVSLTYGQGPSRVVKVERVQAGLCLRCRRLQAEPGQELCPRCHTAVLLAG